MRRREEPEELELQAGMLRRVLTNGLDEASQFLLVNVIETYFPVPDGERERYRRLLSRKEYEVVQEVDLTWGDKLILQGKRAALKRQLMARFGPLSSELEARLESVYTEEELDGYLDRVLTASSLEEIGLES